MSCGSPLLTNPGYVPTRDATVVNRLLDTGAQLVGKTNMDEFTFGGSQKSMRLLLVQNPYDRNRQPGSSSAGSGIVNATGEVDRATGVHRGTTRLTRRLPWPTLLQAISQSGCPRNCTEKRPTWTKSFATPSTTPSRPPARV